MIDFSGDLVRLVIARFDGLVVEPTRCTRSTHSESSGYQCHTNTGDVSIIVKHTNASTPEKAAEVVTREFKGLSKVWQMTRAWDEGSVPKPLEVLPERALLVREDLPGIAFSTLLRTTTNYFAALFRKNEACAAAARMGVWLRRFHEASRQSPMAHESQRFEQEINEQLELCLRRGLAPREAEKLSRIASEGSRQIAGRALPAAARHGDFTPRNVLVDGRRIGVVDFENFADCDTIYEDVSKFVAFLDLLKGRPGYSGRAIDSVANSFLLAYGISDDIVLVKLFALKAAVRIFAHRGSGRIARWFAVDYLYRRNLERFAAELQARLVALK